MQPNMSSCSDSVDNDSESIHSPQLTGFLTPINVAVLNSQLKEPDYNALSLDELKSLILQSYRVRFTQFNVAIDESIVFVTGPDSEFGRFRISLGSNRKGKAVLNDDAWNKIETKTEELIQCIPFNDEQATKRECAFIQRLRSFVQTRTLTEAAVDKVQSEGKDQYDRLTFKARKMFDNAKVCTDEKNLNFFMFYSTLIIMSHAYPEKVSKFPLVLPS